ncbi:MAG: class I SAM-dependent methyltransferase [Methylophilus sp.]|nr:class I SAM-dependent methyltransferase [Methylophilus sp.]MDP3607666.1 class I SAM-dependent methyltransferase [Methylophilus sp.]
MKVLKNNSQIENARRELIQRGASCLESPFQTLLRRFRLHSGVKLGDKIKSWDVLETLKFLDQNIQKHDPVLDIGCYASEIIVALHKQGYTNLTGADLNPELNLMPGQGSIRYETTNFMHTPFPDASFKAITSISVIEHGFDAHALLKEMSRLLKSGGYFIASFDYWPEKIDTTGIKFFDMDWLIFSKDDVANFIQLANNYGFKAVGDFNANGEDTPIECGGKKYTFGWLVLEKI